MRKSWNGGINMNYAFKVPESKKIRVIIHTDAKNEADDQFAIVHHLMTPKFKVKGIIAAHFEAKLGEGKEQSMEQSYREIQKVLALMNIENEYEIYKGALGPLKSENSPRVSEGAKFIIKEAMSDDSLPLFVVFLGSLTDLASAYLMEPQIANKMTAVWIGGGEWPIGGFEFNLLQDINAANVVFKSDIPLWQVPKNVYKLIRTTLAELQCRVQPYGKIGDYLFRQMVEYNDEFAEQPMWPQGESWNLGDQPTVSVLLEDHEHDWDWKPAPIFSKEMFYIHGQQNRSIRVYRNIDSRLTLEDFYCKLQLNFPRS
jgi:inosine-uridine nucleoside N-ribohydrolase